MGGVEVHTRANRNHAGDCTRKVFPSTNDWENEGPIVRSFYKQESSRTEVLKVT